MHTDRWVFAKGLTWTLIVSVLVPIAAFAKDKAAKSKDEPPGWSKGKKKGWTDDVPPGIAKKGGWMPPGLSKKEQEEWKDGGPPGWSRGDKDGWDGGDTPPGQRKKAERHTGGEDDDRGEGPNKRGRSDKKTAEDLDQAGKELRRRGAKLKRFSEEDLKSAETSLRGLVKSGVPVRRARRIVQSLMDGGVRGRDIETATRGVAYGVERGVEPEEAEDVTRRNLKRGLKGDDLATNIYKEMSARRRGRQDVPKHGSGADGGKRE